MIWVPRQWATVDTAPRGWFLCSDDDLNRSCYGASYTKEPSPIPFTATTSIPATPGARPWCTWCLAPRHGLLTKLIRRPAPNPSPAPSRAPNDALISAATSRIPLSGVTVCAGQPCGAPAAPSGCARGLADQCVVRRLTASAAAIALPDTRRTRLFPRTNRTPPHASAPRTALHTTSKKTL
jgi:hypothetical protein